MSPIAGTTSTNGRSVWADTFPEHERITFPALERDLDVDVAIVGGGLTGLWAALHLLQRDPALRVAVVERQRDIAGWVGHLREELDVPTKRRQVGLEVAGERVEG